MSVTTLATADALEQPVDAPADSGESGTTGKTAKKQRGPVGRVVHVITVGLSTLLLAGVALLAVVVIGIPAVAHATPYTILTGSMQPTLPPGTLVVVRKTPTADIRIGDVITYQIKSGQPAVVTHRVVSIQQPSAKGDTVHFITKGDANNLDDPAVRPVQVRGVVWYAVPYIGWVNNVVTGSMRGTLVPIAAGVLFLYAAWMVVSDQLGRRRKRRAAAAEAREAASA